MVKKPKTVIIIFIPDNSEGLNTIIWSFDLLSLMGTEDEWSVNLNHWDERFQEEEYIYGTVPNEWLRSTLGSVNGKEVALLAEGEGRNAVYLAKQGNEVTAFDFSKEGINKTKSLAAEENVKVNTYLQDITVEDALPRDTYDVSATIFGHVPPDGKDKMFSNLANCVKLGGSIIFELYSKRQLEFKTGGPPDINMLYDVEEIKNILGNLSVDIIDLEEIITFRQEGRMHNGKSAVIQGRLTKV